jgi:TRAP-type C4-dicarboxylate transport system substrate-binding protein
MLQSSFVCGKALLDGMPDADRATFIKVVNDTVLKYSAIIAQEEQGIYYGFKARNMTVTEIDRAQFEAAIAPLYTNNDLGLSPGLKDNLFRQLGL